MKNKSLSKIALMGIASGLAISGQASAEFEASSTLAAVGCNSRSAGYYDNGYQYSDNSGYYNNGYQPSDNSRYYNSNGYQSSDNSGYYNNGYNNGSYGREGHSCGAQERSYPNAPRASASRNQNGQQNFNYDQNAAMQNDVNSDDINVNRNVNNSNANSSSFKSSSNYSK